MIKVSVIIPVFGVEQYIEKCARSLFSQTLQDMEFIFVDDCTKDRSIDIIKETLKDYPNRIEQTFFLHHEVNMGLPTARKTGILSTKGEFIAHCDGDDWVELNTYESLYQKAIYENAEVVISDYYRVSNWKVTKCKACVEGLCKDEIYKRMFSQKVPFMVWNKLIKADIYKKDIIYPTETHAEDMALILQLLYYAKTIAYLPRPFYYYVVNSNTALHVYNEETYMKKFNASITNAALLEKFYSDKPQSNTLINGIIYLKLTTRDKIIALLDQEKYYNIWKNTFPEINKHILFNKDINFRHKLKYYLIKYRLYKFKS
jgi:glycosyltransferase involved in cell wall biosynthesis